MQPAVLADLIHRVGHLAAVLVPVGKAGFHLARAASQQQLHVAPHPHQPLDQIVGVPRPLGVHHVLVQPHQPVGVVHRVVSRVVGVIVIIVLDDRPVQTVVFVVHPLPVPVQRRRQPVPAVVAVARQRLRGDKRESPPAGLQHLRAGFWVYLDNEKLSPFILSKLVERIDVGCTEIDDGCLLQEVTVIRRFTGNLTN